MERARHCSLTRFFLSHSAAAAGAAVVPSYWLMQFDTNAPTLKSLNDRLRQDPRVVKWNTLKLGERLDQIVPPGVSSGASTTVALGGRTIGRESH